MAFLCSRDGSKLNIIILLLLVELWVLVMYVSNNGRKTKSECHQNEKAIEYIESSPHIHKESMKDTDQNAFHTSLMRVQNSLHPPLHSVTDKPQDNHLPTSMQPQRINCAPLPSDQELYAMSHDLLAHHYHNYVNTIQMQCRNTVRHGNAGDGGWDLCIDPPYNIDGPCTVYSFGIKDDWSFDDSITTKNNCQLHAYDPSVTFEDYDRKPNLHFHRTGLGSSDGINQMRWRMRTFSTMLKENGHSEVPIDVLKMDIEGSEWEALPQMLASGALNNVRQMCFEVHVRIGSQPEPSSDMYIRGIKLFKDLYRAGFRIFKTHKNMDAKYRSMYGILRTGCHEIYMVKTNEKSSGCE